MAKTARKHDFRYVRTALEKYQRLTGKHISGDIGIKNIAKIISGKNDSNRTKTSSWNFIIKYCEGEKLISQAEGRLLKEIRQTAGKSFFVQPKEYNHDKAVEFYKSREWRELRVQIIEEQKGECQMCGRSHKKHGITIHVDHIVPISKNWARRLDKSNLQLLCEDCNLGKSNHYSTDWRQ